MLPPHMLPLLIGVLVGLIVSLTIWGFVRGRNPAIGIDRTNELLLAMLALAVFAVAIFLMYLLLTLGAGR